MPIPAPRYPLAPFCLFVDARILSFATLIAIACCGNAAKEVPKNYILLSIFTVCEGIMVGTITLYFKAEVVWLALLMTVLVTAGLTLFACQTKQVSLSLFCSAADCVYTG